MGRPYDDELSELPTTYQWAAEISIHSLAAAISATLDSPLVAIGSGGSLTVADFAAQLHREVTGAPASAHTPLEAVTSGVELRRFSVMLVTAGGGNPDVVGAFKHLASREAGRLIVLCLRTGSPLARSKTRFPFVDLVEFNAPWGQDGFLATNSLIASTVLLTRAYSAASGRAIQLPKKWEELTGGVGRTDNHRAFQLALSRDTLVVLHGPQTRSAAIDMESKLTEAALRNVWTADFRHFAHGRHHWLAKRAMTSAALAIITPTDHALADATLALIPKSVPIVRERIPFTGTVGTLAALARVMYIVGSAGAAVGIDPGRPGVPPFGSRIYRLNAFQSDGRAQSAENVAISRKTRMNLERLSASGILDELRKGYREFVDKLSSTVFRGIVLDYDGTICGELDRYSPLAEPVAAELDRLLRGGLIIGIATGRGKSVRERLRDALARQHWSRVVIGYYNGGDVALLQDDEKPDGAAAPTEGLRPVAEALQRHPLLKQLASFEFRIPQLKIEVKRPQDAELTWDIVQQIVAMNGTAGLALLRSSHSMDIVAPGVNKLAVVKRVAQMAEGLDAPVLCIGDRGRYPGNDHLLIGTSYGLSVDETAPDMNSGWNLAPLGYRGVDAAVSYLRHLKLTRRGARFILKRN